MVFKRETRVISVLLTLFMLFMLWPGASFAAAPTITAAEMDYYMSADSIRLQVSFSEGVYGNADHNAPVSKDDFQLNVNSHGGAVTNAVISAVNTTGNNAPAGGEDRLLFYLTLTGGPPSGVETIEVSPLTDSVYNGSGEVMAVSAGVGATLWDKRVDFAPGYPKAGSTQNEGSKQAQLVIYPLNETVIAYYVVVADGANPPSADQVMAGKDSDGNNPLAKGQHANVNTGGIDISVILPDDATDYDAWVVIKDAAGNITGPAKADLRTPDPAGTSYVCEIVGGPQYATLDEALAAVPEKNDSPITIKLLANVTDNNGIEIRWKKITFNLNGKTLTINNPTDNNNGKGLEVHLLSEVNVTGPGNLNISSKMAGLDVNESNFITSDQTTVNINSQNNIGIYADTDCTIVVNGDVSGASAGVTASSGNNITVTGTVTATGTGANHAVFVYYPENTVSVGSAVVSSGTGAGVYIDDHSSDSHVTVGSQAEPGQVVGKGHGIWTRMMSDPSTVTVYGDVEGAYNGISNYGGCDITVYGNVYSTSSATESYGVYGFVNSYTSNIVVEGNVVGVNGVYIHDGQSTVTVTGNVTALGTSTAENIVSGVRASYASCNVGGNVTANNGTGAYSFEQSEITVDGTISAQKYITVKYDDKAIGDNDAFSTKPGYLQYSVGYANAIVWVKGAAGGPIPVESITVTGAGNATSVKKGNTLQMNAAVSPSSATDKTVTWSVENGTGTATINATGLLTGTGAGTVTVRATAHDGSGISGAREITITSSGDSGGGGGGGGISISKPSVVTGNASSITVQSAVLNGEISSPGGTVITAYGFSYSSDEEQWTEVKAGSDNLSGSFSYTLSGLKANTVYYFKAYATNSAGTSYGAVTSFLVLEEQATMAPPAQTVLRFYIGQNDYYVNDQARTMDTAPIIVGGRTMLPIRYMAEPLGATVNWDGNERKVTVILNNQTIELWIGQNLARVNGVETAIDENNPEVKPFITPSGRSMLPLSFIARTLGCRVDWDPAVQEVLVTYPA